MSFERARTLRSRTYIGLILSQFLAAFNDQAIHIVAIFYGVDMLVRYVGLPRVDDKFIVAVVTACFISPFFLFSPLAGVLADKYSKQRTLVFWKLAEVLMMAVALFGFVMPHLGGLGFVDHKSVCVASSVLVISAVFMMGTHSAFFIPAKYGVMPEILHPTVLSRGNGFLEGTSFVAQIIGTSVGSYLYGMTKSVRNPTTGELVLGQEWVIGVVLTALALVGAAASMLIARMPAAAPDIPLTWKLWRPLRKNIGILMRSRPLALAVLGIAFFAFMTLFLRQTLIYEGEAGKELAGAKAMRGARQIAEERFDPAGDVVDAASEAVDEPRENSELKIALLISMVGLGVGIGSSWAGYLSGEKVELGLVPIGAVFLILFTSLLALALKNVTFMVVCLVLIGVAAGLYIVPLYTLLQHRAPKDSKGNLVATSNFVNVAGGLLAVVVFYLITLIMERVLGIGMRPKVVQADPSLLPQYLDELQRKLSLPMALCLVASVMTIGMLVLLCRQLPDFLVRTLLWMRSQGRYHLSAQGLENLPTNGAVLLATNCHRFEDAMHVVASTDRYIRFFLFESAEAGDDPRGLERFLARQTGLVTLAPGQTGAAEWEQALTQAAQSLALGEIVAVTIEDDLHSSDPARFFLDLHARINAPVQVVRCDVREPDPAQRRGPEEGRAVRRARVAFGAPLEGDLDEARLRASLDNLARLPDAPPHH